jgi:hypothetical protein
MSASFGEQCAWVSQSLFVTIVAALRLYLDTYQGFLLFESCKAYIASCVYTACASVGAWPVVVPSLVTWLLQIMDTHVFRRYKARIQCAYHDACAEGLLDIDRFLQCVYVIDEMMHEPIWQVAFADNGFGVDQTRLSNAVLRHLQLEREPLTAAGGRSILRMCACAFRGTCASLRLCFRAWQRSSLPRLSAPLLPRLCQSSIGQ